MLPALGFLICLAAVLLAMHTGTYSDGGLRIFDGGAAFLLAVIGGSLVSS
jgi:hypothetical protein